MTLSYAMSSIFDLHASDVWLSTSDFGWVVGHSFILYGPLLVRATSIIYEGKPIYPNAGILWKMIEKYHVKGLFTAPTAIRTLRKEDCDGKYISQCNLSCLKNINVAGERCDP